MESAGRRRLRILYLPSWYPHPEHKTYGIFLRVQAEALTTRHDVVVVPVPQPASLLRRPRVWIDRIEFRRSPAGVGELAASGPNLTPGFPGSYERTVWRLYRRGFDEAVRLFGRAPDLIHAHVSVNAGYFGARLARMYGRPLILTEHISRPELLLQDSRHRRWFFHAMEQADWVIAVSGILRERLHAAGVAREIDVVANPVDTALFSPGEASPPPGPLRLIVVGHLIPRKGIDRLLAAVAHLERSDGLALGVDLVGRGVSRPGLEKQAAALGLGNRVRFHGERSPQDTRDLLRACHIYVCPSLTESFAVAVVEAMSVGLPVVVTRSGGPESYVTPAHGAVVEPGSAEALARGIREVVGRLDRFDRACQRRYVLERFAPEVVVEELPVATSGSSRGTLVGDENAPLPAEAVVVSRGTVAPGGRNWRANTEARWPSAKGPARSRPTAGGTPWPSAAPGVRPRASAACPPTARRPGDARHPVLRPSVGR